jgi:DNA mismatch repair protein MutS
LKLTPMMQQYYSIKEQYPDAILFFRLGDFYEMFGDDAKTASKVLEIALTSREAGAMGRIPMCGVPHHAAEPYVDKLIRSGYRVALCEQLEDPKQAKGVVKRDVIRVITPGTFIEGQLEKAENQYLVSLAWHGESWGLAYLDMSTGEFMATSLANWDRLADELTWIQPAEIVVTLELDQDQRLETLAESLGATVTRLQHPQLSTAAASQRLMDHFQTATLKPYGLTSVEQIAAAGLALKYVVDTQRSMLTHIRTVKGYTLEEFLQIDGHSRQNLELTSTIRDRKKAGSLLGVMDQTVTSMGARLLRSYLEKPLVDLAAIEARLDAVEALVDQTALRLELREQLDEIRDLERLLSRLVMGSGNARDLNSLAASLEKIQPVKELLQGDLPELLASVEQRLDPLQDLVHLIRAAILDEPSLTLREGNLIRDGYNEELDKLRQASRGGKDWIRRLERVERDRTGIKSLKVGYNRVFGYYIEVTKANIHLVPEDYERKQTLANAERYITPALKEQEALILGADERINELEYELFVEVRDKVKDHVEAIQNNSHALAILDVLQGLATVAVERNFVRPQLEQGLGLHLVESRHPVVEAIEGQFVPNDVTFDESQRIILLTGPNMAGKSTYLRQVALIVILAQMGSFVPAQEARIGIVDRIFTRIGAADDLSSGQSTFMVECAETAQLLLNATENSLIILDELGRGTSTFDGMAIAQAVVEYIHDTIGARTLFSTHFHELTKLEMSLKYLVSYRVEVEERDGRISFLHRVSRGSTDRSYGINVARMAGVPGPVLQRSLELLHELEAAGKGPIQLDLFHRAVYDASVQEIASVAGKPSENNLEKKLLELDLNNLTPLEALQTLAAWQSEARVEANDDD